jgi:hypothetical protein
VHTLARHRDVLLEYTQVCWLQREHKFVVCVCVCVCLHASVRGREMSKMSQYFCVPFVRVAWLDASLWACLLVSALLYAHRSSAHALSGTLGGRSLASNCTQLLGTCMQGVSVLVLQAIANDTSMRLYAQQQSLRRLPAAHCAYPHPTTPKCAILFPPTCVCTGVQAHGVGSGRGAR